MKKISGIKLGLGVFALAAMLFTFLPSKAFAANPVISAGSNLYVASGSKSNSASTATYDASTKTLNLRGYSGNVTISNTTGKVTISGSGTISKLTLTNTNVDFVLASVTINQTVATSSTVNFSASSNITLANDLVATSVSSSLLNSNGAVATATTLPAGTWSNVGGVGANPEVPDTIDMVHVYVAILMVSSAILAYRRYLAKH